MSEKEETVDWNISKSKALFYILFFFAFSILKRTNAQSVDIVQVPYLQHVEEEVLSWAVISKIKLDSNDRFTALTGFSNAYSEFGKNFSLIAYIAIGQLKINERLKLDAGYIGGQASRVGWLNGVVVGPEYKFINSLWHPRIRLLYGYSWFGEGQEEGIERPQDNHNVRFRLDFTKSILRDDRVSMIFRIEPFLYKRNEGAFKEVRTILGPNFRLNENINLAPFYANRWSKNDVSIRWRHELSINLLLNI